MGAAPVSRSRSRVAALALAALLGAPLALPGAGARIADAPEGPLAPLGVGVAQSLEGALFVISILSHAEVLPDDGGVHVSVESNVSVGTGGPATNATTGLTATLPYPGSLSGKDTKACTWDDVAGQGVFGRVHCEDQNKENRFDTYTFEIYPGFVGRVTLTLHDAYGRVLARYTCTSAGYAPASAELVTREYGYACDKNAKVTGLLEHKTLRFRLTFDGTGHAWGRAVPS